MKNLSFANRVRTVIIAIILLGLLISSCRTGYGCHGNESWRGMVRRINGYGYIPNIKKHSWREIDRAMSYSSWEYDMTKSQDSRSSDHLK